jgi:thiol-disulfide isomerase/thioredoxin
MVKLSDFRGKVVLLRFWGSWCETCKAEQPSLEQVAASSDDLVVLAVASDTEWEPIRKKLAGGSNATVLLDPPEDSAVGPVAEAYGVGKVPESFIIDREGIVRYYLVNRRDWRGSVAQTCLRSILDE